MKAALTEVLNARDARGSSSNSSQRFSAVNSTAAQQFYNMNNIAIEDGNELDPLPGDSLDCGSFDMSNYPDEEFATGPFLQHIEQSLKKNKVTTGRNGFSVKDVRDQSRMYQLPLPSGRVLSGGFNPPRLIDGAVLPYGLMADSARPQLRCGIEVKHSDAHKAAYKQKQAGKPVAGTESSVQFTGQVKGQALMEVVAAAVYAEYPEVMLLHSSYDDNVILLFSEGQVTIWQGCSFNAAMAKMIIEQLDSVTAGLDQGAKFSTTLEFFLAARYSELVQAHVHASSSHDGPNMMHGAPYIS